MTDDYCSLSLGGNKLLFGDNALAGGSSTPQQANACEEYCRARGRKISYGNARIPPDKSIAEVFQNGGHVFFGGVKKAADVRGAFG